MAIVILMRGGFIDSSIALDVTDATSNAFVAGNAATITASGARLAKGADETDVVGFFNDNSATLLAGDVQIGDITAGDTTQTGSETATIVFGAQKLALSRAADESVPPFIAAPTGGGAWAVSERIYAADTGWDDTVASSGPSYGFVTVAPASADDTMEVYSKVAVV